MIISHANSLHERVTNDWAAEFEVGFFRILAMRLSSVCVGLSHCRDKPHTWDQLRTTRNVA